MHRGKPVKWGLEIRKKPQQRQKRVIQRHSAFAQESDSSSDDNDITKINTKTREHYKKQREIKAEQQYAKVLKEDATAFQYDEVYDDIQSGRKAKLKRIQHEKVARKSKYIKGLMANAAIREKLNRRAKENELKRQRMKTDQIYQDKKKFVTRAYQEKIKEEERLKQLVDLKDKRDTQDRGNFNTFFSNIYKDLHKEHVVESSSSSSSSDSSDSESEDSHGKKRKRRKDSSPKRCDSKRMKPSKLSEKEMKRHLKTNPDVSEVEEKSVNSAKERYLARLRNK